MVELLSSWTKTALSQGPLPLGIEPLSAFSRGFCEMPREVRKLVRGAMNESIEGES
jgi:hypothetical protein